MDEDNHRSFNVATFGSTVTEAGDRRPFRGSISPARGALERFRPTNDELSPSNSQLQRGIHALIEAMRSALEGDGAGARYFIGNASASLRDADGEREPTAVSAANSNRCCGGLAPWQIRLLMTHVEANLGGTIHCEDLARLVRLSLSHFMRVFKESFGCAPHAFLIRRRMERAQGLMLTTDEALGQIAVACGLADQSHLTRLFQKWVGESPAAWRRARMTALESP